MTIEQLKHRHIHSEAYYTTSRSSGPGGQNVNKVNSRVELHFNVEQSILLSELEKTRIMAALANKITQQGELIIAVQDSRSQLHNKQLATERFYSLIAAALKPRKKRIPSKRTKASVERRLLKKKQVSAKKADRRFRTE